MPDRKRNAPLNRYGGALQNPFNRMQTNFEQVKP